MYVCMYVCMYICMYVCMYVSIYVSMYLCIYVSMYLCIYVSMYLCMCMCICICLCICICILCMCMYVCMYVCMYIYIYMCIYIYIQRSCSSPHYAIPFWLNKYPIYPFSSHQSPVRQRVKVTQVVDTRCRRKDCCRRSLVLPAAIIPEGREMRMQWGYNGILTWYDKDILLIHMTNSQAQSICNNI